MCQVGGFFGANLLTDNKRLSWLEDLRGKQVTMPLLSKLSARAATGLSGGLFKELQQYLAHIISQWFTRCNIKT